MTDQQIAEIDNSMTAERTLTFPSRMARMMAEGALERARKQAKTYSAVRDLVKPFKGFRVTDVIPVSESNATAEAGSFVVKVEKGQEDTAGYIAEYHSVHLGDHDHLTWPTLVSALVHLAARMSSPAGKSDGGYAASYACRVIGHDIES